MKALVTIVDPAVLMENFDLEQLIPAYASMVASKRMEIVKTLTVMNYVGMLTVGETTGVVMDGASSMTSNVTLALRVVPVGPRQNRNGMKLESVEQQISDEQDAADQQLILDRLQLLSEASISHTKFANGIRSLQHQLRSAFGQTDTESSSHPELAGFGLAGFAPTHTTIDIGVHASSRERVKGRVMIECPSERF
jgi:hypothetical protein